MITIPLHWNVQYEHLPAPHPKNTSATASGGKLLLLHTHSNICLSLLEHYVSLDEVFQLSVITIPIPMISSPKNLPFCAGVQGASYPKDALHRDLQPLDGVAAAPAYRTIVRSRLGNSTIMGPSKMRKKRIVVELEEQSELQCCLMFGLR